MNDQNKQNTTNREINSTFASIANSSDPEIREVNKYIDSFDFDGAKVILENKLKREPDNIEVIDILSEVYFNLDEIENTIRLIKKSISIDPDRNPEKYMTLGQVLKDYKESLKCYEKGIQLFLRDLQVVDSSRLDSLKSSLAGAYASVAEIYMNSDLCFEANAEEFCERSLAEALKYDPNSFDALTQMSNLRILRKRDEEAVVCMDKIYEHAMKCASSSLINTEYTLPEHDTLLNLSKNYAEVGLFQKAIKVLDILVKIDDEDLECWYLLAFNHYSYKNYKHSMRCLKNFKAAYEKLGQGGCNSELEEAAKELYLTLEEIKKNKGGLYNENVDEEEQTPEVCKANEGMNVD